MEKIFDTHEYVKELVAAGFTERQAETIAHTQVRLIESHLATRRDLKEVEIALKRDLKEVEIALKGDLKEVEIALKGDLRELENRLLLKLGGYIGIVALLLKFIG